MIESELQKVMSQRDELLAALKNLIDANDTDTFVGGEWDEAKTAVERVEKQK